MQEYLEFFEVFFRDLFLFFALLYIAEYLTGTVFVFPWMRVYTLVAFVFFLGRFIFRFAASRLFPSAPPRLPGLPVSGAAPAPSGGGGGLQGPRLTKVTRRETSEISQLEFVASEMQGWRDAMEDAYLACPEFSDGISVFAVFDGHGGCSASRRCSEFFLSDFRAHLSSDSVSSMASVLTKTYASLDDRLLLSGGMDLTGTTAVVAVFFRPPDRPSARCIAVANAGDSRALLCRDGQAVELSHDHKPESPRERQRIEKAGGRVTAMGPCYRVDWGLNLSRSLGDFAYKKNQTLEAHEQKISAIPDVVIEELDEDKDEFLLLACDGVFELLSSQEVVDFVRSSLKRGLSLEKTTELLLDECCAKDPTLTMGRGTDNETCIIVRLLNRNKT